MKYDDGLFDLKQVSAITSDLRSLCEDMAERLHAVDPAAALEFAEGLRTRRISADTFVEAFREQLIGRLDRSRLGKATDAKRKSH